MLHPFTLSPCHLVTLSPRLTPSPAWRLRGAAFLAGIGFTHHGLFVIIGLPLLLGYVAWQLCTWRLPLKQLTILALCFAAGLAPWLYPLAQFARYGPFDGDNYGLPRHYFWGSPVSWRAVLDLLTGGTVRRGIFRAPSVESSLAVLRMVGDRLLFEFGPLGVLLGALGCAAMARRARGAWLGAAWAFLITLLYLLLLGPAVEDAPVFTLPMLLPWALWIAVGIARLIALAGRPPTTDHRPPTTDQRPPHPLTPSPPHPFTPSPLHPFTPSPLHPTPRLRWPALVVALLIVATVAWGYSRLPYSNKRHLWLFRQFGQATLDQLPPGAVVMTHWEQGMTLQYLVLAERIRPDVWVDVVEPGDDAWGQRAQRRYAGRPVFFVGAPSDVAGLPVELVREDSYADLFRLRADRQLYGIL